MFEEVYSTLLRSHDPAIPRERWRNIFTPSWADSSDDGKVGYVLVEGRRLVGFLGLVVCRRRVANSIESFANVTSWVTRNGAGYGALLLFPLRELRSHTITNFTSTPVASRVFRRMGFKALDTHYHVVPTLQPRRGPRWDVVEDDRDIVEVLTQSDLTIYRDHAPYVQQLVARMGAQYCYMVYSEVQRRGVRVAKVHHFGGQGDLNNAIPDFGRHLFRTKGTLAFDCDERLITPRFTGWSIRRELVVPRLYRSQSLEPEQISELYSELVLLGNA